MVGIAAPKLSSTIRTWWW